MSMGLVEKVARALCASSGDEPDMVFTGFEDHVWMEWVDNAKPAILAVLEHFSEPGNVTDAMVAAGWGDYHENAGTGRKVIAATFLAAMRAEKEAVLGGSACHSVEQHMPETTTKGEQAG